jgi:hypothetical protein
MKIYQALTLFLSIFCLGEISVGQSVADRQATEDQMKSSVFEALKMAEDDWFKVTSALKDENLNAFDRALSSILRDHLKFTTQSDDGMSRYSGIRELSIKRAIVFCLRDNFSTDSAASTIENILSLAAEGKIATLDQSKLLLDLLFKYDGFSATGALASVTEKYDASARSQILSEVARRNEENLLSKESSILFLKKAFSKEKDLVILNQLNQLNFKMGIPSNTSNSQTR